MLPGQRSLDFKIQMVREEFGANNMKTWIHKQFQLAVVVEWYGGYFLETLLAPQTQLGSILSAQLLMPLSKGTLHHLTKLI